MSRKTIPWEIPVLFLTALLLLVALGSARRRADILGLRADSIQARADTLRVAFADSLATWRRRAVQLPTTPATRVVVRPVLQVDTVRIVDTVEVMGDEVRTATFLKYQPPVSLRAEVALPPAGQAGTLDATLAVDPIPLTVRIACGGATDGIYPVEAVVTTPTEVTLRMDTPMVDPNVCNQPTPRAARSWPYTLLVGLVAGLALR